MHVLRAMEFLTMKNLDDYSLEKDNYILLTLHRQENTRYE